MPLHVSASFRLHLLNDWSSQPEQVEFRFGYHAFRVSRRCWRRKSDRLCRTAESFVRDGQVEQIRGDNAGSARITTCRSTVTATLVADKAPLHAEGTCQATRPGERRGVIEVIAD